MAFPNRGSALSISTVGLPNISQIEVLKPTSSLAPITSAKLSHRLLRPAGFDCVASACSPVIEMTGFA